MTISPDGLIFWQWGGFSLNATIVFTWLVMGVLTLISWLVTRRHRQQPPEDASTGYTEIRFRHETTDQVVRIHRCFRIS